MKILGEFKTFAMKGNVIDLAVGVVIGGAFGKIVSSLVADIITPTVGILVGGIDFTKLGYTIRNIKGSEVTITYGNFLQTLFDFLIIAFSIFIVVKLINKAQEKVIKKQKAEEKKEILKKADDIILLEEIRDLLKIDKGVKINKTFELKEEAVKKIDAVTIPKKTRSTTKSSISKQKIIK